MPEERRLVTILFADIVGSTPLAGEHDAEVIRSAFEAAFERIEPVIREHGGAIEKFIGDAVMAVFGVPQAHDDDAERAIRAAFAIRDAVADIGGPLPLRVRIGVTTGEAVTRTDGGDQRLATSLAVNLAHRLQSAADPSEIVVGDLTHRLTERSIRYGARRTIDAKGVGDVPAWVAEALVSSLPERELVRGSNSPFVDREQDIGRLRDLFRRVASEGHPLLVTILGPAGVGKTRLIERFLEDLEPSRVLRGRCLPYGEGAASFPLQQMLRLEARTDLADSRKAVTEKMCARVAEVIGADDELEAIQRRILVLAGVAAAADELAGIATGDVADELRWAFRTYVERRAVAAPAVLFFEDIHWAAQPMLDLIEHLSLWVRAPLLILCLARPELREARPGWGIGAPRSTSFELEPLSASDTEHLIRLLFGSDVPSETVEREVVTRSDGNPLYVEELVRALLETGHVVRAGGQWIPRSGSTMSVPPTLQGLIAARLDRISREAKRVVQEAAVVGRTFSSVALTAVHGEPVGTALREAMGTQIVEETEAPARGKGTVYRFRHILFREVAYGMLPKSDRAVLHDRYRQWFEHTTGERQGEFIELIADHADQAYRLAAEVRSPDEERLAKIAFDRLRVAAGRSRDRGDLRTSLELWRRTNEIGQTLDISASERIQSEGNLLLLRTSFEQSDGLWADVEAWIERARAVGASEPLVRLLIANARRTRISSTDRSATLMQEALLTARSLRDDELIAHALLQLPLIPYASGDLAEVERLREEALAYAKSRGVTRELSACLRAVAESALRSGSFSRAAALLDEAERLAQERGSKAARFAAMASRAEVLVWTGPWDEALRYAPQLGPLAADLATPSAQIEHLSLLGLALRESGDLQGARSAQSAALGMAQPDTFELVYATFNLVFTLIALGEVREARRIYQLVVPIELPWQDYHAIRAVVAAALHAAEGESGAAEVLYQQALEIFEQGTTAPTQWRRAQQLYAEFLIREGRGDEARNLLEQVLDFYRDPKAAPRRERVAKLLARAGIVRAG